MSIVFLWMHTVESAWVDTWPKWTQEQVREATLAAAQRAWDKWQRALNPCETPQNLAKQIEKELNA
ncbi:hypothetical protein [Mycobacterium sp. AZCC_0083]|uniref:hypothetical protein n=1 Tax=Mycobacterium sp. AZCC_0083 TaxID=2735882 RepID=UPI00160D9FBD|nr:hypothetical protein [Mycobacterium sp. AZCC_0083]MBB5167110.1 hypothetical protein [Mycobacterium sp. AZCC_0083]